MSFKLDKDYVKRMLFLDVKKRKKFQEHKNLHLYTLKQLLMEFIHILRAFHRLCAVYTLAYRCFQIC